MIPQLANRLGLRLVIGMVGVAIIWLTSALSFPPPVNATPAERSKCQMILHQLGLAILNYQEQKGRFLPAYTTDSFGNRLHSWRTLILPYIERADLFKKINWSKPWDSLQNQPVTNTQLSEYQCPYQANIDRLDTSYVAIIGPGTIWDPALEESKKKRIKDGPENTIMLVEMKQSKIAWASPRDLDLSDLPAGITEQNLLAALTNHEHGFNAVFADGHVEQIPTTIPFDDFKALLTVDGGENHDQWRRP